tara:strand:- start:888 stop:1598 length:711 start_codon:yes stop_codon:yes gene_type:complete
MLAPRITYFISSKSIFDNNDNKDIYYLTLGKNNNLEVITIMPDKNNDLSLISGNNIKCTKNVITHRGEEYCFDELAIGYENDNSYLIVETTKLKIWHLPNNVTIFLELDIIINESFGLSILDKKACIIKYGETNTIPSKCKMLFSKELILRITGGLTKENDKNINPVNFIYYDSDNYNEIEKKSYFETYNSKYYFKDCLIICKNNILGVYGKFLKYNNEIISDVITPCMGYINLTE